MIKDTCGRRNMPVGPAEGSPTPVPLRPQMMPAPALSGRGARRQQACRRAPVHHSRSGTRDLLVAAIGASRQLRAAAFQHLQQAASRYHSLQAAIPYGTGPGAAKTGYLSTNVLAHKARRRPHQRQYADSQHAQHIQERQTMQQWGSIVVDGR